MAIPPSAASFVPPALDARPCVRRAGPVAATVAVVIPRWRMPAIPPGRIPPMALLGHHPPRIHATSSVPPPIAAVGTVTPPRGWRHVRFIPPPWKISWFILGSGPAAACPYVHGTSSVIALRMIAAIAAIAAVVTILVCGRRHPFGRVPPPGRFSILPFRSGGRLGPYVHGMSPSKRSVAAVVAMMITGVMACPGGTTSSSRSGWCPSNIRRTRPASTIIVRIVRWNARGVILMRGVIPMILFRGRIALMQVRGVRPLDVRLFYWICCCSPAGGFRIVSGMMTVVRGFPLGCWSRGRLSSAPLFIGRALLIPLVGGSILSISVGPTTASYRRMMLFPSLGRMVSALGLDVLGSMDGRITIAIPVLVRWLSGTSSMVLGGSPRRLGNTRTAPHSPHSFPVQVGTAGSARSARRMIGGLPPPLLLLLLLRSVVSSLGMASRGGFAASPAIIRRR